MMIMWCQNIEDIQRKCAEWMVGGRKAGTENRKGDKHAGRDLAGNYRISPINTKINKITVTEW